MALGSLKPDSAGASGCKIGISDSIVWISNFRRVLNFVLFILGGSPASVFYVPTFRSTVYVTSS